MGVKMILYILAFAIMVGVVFMIERRDTQAGSVALKKATELAANLTAVDARVTAVDAKLARLDGILERLEMLERLVEMNANKADEMFRVSESRVATIETLAHSAKMDAMRRPQKIEIDLPPVRIVQACGKKKKVPVSVQSPSGVDGKVIKDIKKKLKDLSQ
jgi:hypothetical protein